MKTKLNHGIVLIPDSYSTLNISDSKRVDYKITFYFNNNSFNVKTEFISVHKYGFGLLAHNAMCMN